MTKRKPSTTPVWIVTAILTVSIPVVYFVYQSSTNSNESNSEVEQTEPVSTGGVNDPEMLAAMQNVYQDHQSKFPMTWKCQDSESYEIEDSWFQYCRNGELFMIGDLYVRGRDWLRSDQNDYDEKLTIGTGITYQIEGHKGSDQKSISISIVDSPTP